MTIDIKATLEQARGALEEVNKTAYSTNWHRAFLGEIRGLTAAIECMERSEPVGFVIDEDSYGLIAHFPGGMPPAGSKLYTYPIVQITAPQEPDGSVPVGTATPAGAAPLPEDVLQMVDRLRHCVWSHGDEAADMLDLWATRSKYFEGRYEHWFQEASKARGEREALRARIAELEKVPEGFVLVPKEPTSLMVVKGNQAYDLRAGTGAFHMWQAMLAAAPKPEGEENA